MGKYDEHGQNNDDDDGCAGVFQFFFLFDIKYNINLNQKKKTKKKFHAKWTNFLLDFRFLNWFIENVHINTLIEEQEKCIFMLDVYNKKY